MSFVQTERLRPQLFVTRQNGSMIPLVAVDELPPTLSIRGVPRTLSPHDISGMTGVGTFNSRHRQYVVDGLKGVEPPPKPRDRSLIGSGFAANRPLPDDIVWDTASPLLAPPIPKAYGIYEQAPNALEQALSSMAPSEPEPSAAMTDSDVAPFHNFDGLPVGRAPGVKEYCSYWLRHGECDYAQQGCLYRHEMPLDRRTLEKLGLRDIPRWYREKHHLGSYLAGNSTKSGINAAGGTRPNLMERNWRSPPPAPSLDETSRKPGIEAGLLTSSTLDLIEQADANPDMNYCLPSKATASVHQTVTSTHRQVVPNPKLTYHAIVSRHQPSPATSATVTTSVLEPETVSARQIRETIRILDAYDERERDRLSAKYQTLEPQKSSTAIPFDTPSASMASSTTGGAENEEETDEMGTAAYQSASPNKESSVATFFLPCSRPASVDPAPVVTKRSGKAKRRGNKGQGDCRYGRSWEDGRPKKLGRSQLGQLSNSTL